MYQNQEMHENQDLNTNQELYNQASILPTFDNQERTADPMSYDVRENINIKDGNFVLLDCQAFSRQQTESRLYHETSKESTMRTALSDYQHIRDRGRVLPRNQSV